MYDYVNARNPVAGLKINPRKIVAAIVDTRTGLPPAIDKLLLWEITGSDFSFISPQKKYIAFGNSFAVSIVDSTTLALLKKYKFKQSVEYPYERRMGGVDGVPVIDSHAGWISDNVFSLPLFNTWPKDASPHAAQSTLTLDVATDH